MYFPLYEHDDVDDVCVLVYSVYDVSVYSLLLYQYH